MIPEEKRRNEMPEFKTNSYNTGLCACMMDVPSCLDVIFCFCCQTSRQSRASNGDVDTFDCESCWSSLLIGPCCSAFCMRQQVNEEYNIDDCATIACCAFPCSLCQTYRELSLRSSWPGGTCCVKEPFMMQFSNQPEPKKMEDRDERKDEINNEEVKNTDVSVSEVVAVAPPKFNDDA